MRDCILFLKPFFSTFFFLLRPQIVGDYGGPTKRVEPPRHNRDRHYNYPREDAVLIWNPLADKPASLSIDIASDDIGRRLNTRTA
jgi:hypothetical protein